MNGIQNIYYTNTMVYVSGNIAMNSKSIGCLFQIDPSV
jgi:hypothetical protein